MIFHICMHSDQGTRTFWFPSTLSQSVPPPKWTTLLKINSFCLFSTSCKWDHTVCIVLCLASFINVLSVWFSQVFACISGSFFIAIDFSIVWICHNLCIHSSVDSIWILSTSGLLHIQLQYSSTCAFCGYVYSLLLGIQLEIKLLCHRVGYKAKTHRGNWQDLFAPLKQFSMWDLVASTKLHWSDYLKYLNQTY